MAPALRGEAPSSTSRHVHPAPDPTPAAPAKTRQREGEQGPVLATFDTGSVQSPSQRAIPSSQCAASSAQGQGGRVRGENRWSDENDSDDASDCELPSSVDTDDDDEHDDEHDERDSYIHRVDGDPAAMASWIGQPSVKGRSEAMRMILLTFTSIGITFTWGVEMTYCTPYLLKLGLTKSNTSLVWVAGPLSGLIVQPIVGVIADENTSKWGRRRPMMVVGTVIVCASVLTLGFTREIVGLVIRDDERARQPTIVLAVLAIYVVDFAINAVMSCARSLIVDTLPTEKQQAGAAWSSRMSAVGHIIGYGSGALDLVQIFGTTFGDTQFKQLTVIAACSMILSTTVTCWAVTERVLVASKPSKHQGQFKVFRQIYSTMSTMPPRIRIICWVQFWSWIGWFPFLFYGTTWVGETYFRYDAPQSAKQSDDVLGDIGRIGSTSLVIYSFITFAGAFLLPLIVQSPDDAGFTRRPPRAVAKSLEKLKRLKPDLLTTWVCGHLMFSAAMALAPFATSYRFATGLICVCGIPWTIAGWAPTTFLGVEVNKMSGDAGGGSAYRRLSDEPDIELRSVGSGDAPLYLDHGSSDGSATTSTGELSGIYFGILNIYTTIPQFLGTFIAAIVFAVLEPGKSPELATDSGPADAKAAAGGPNAIAVCLFIGAVCTLVAAVQTRKLKTS